MAYSNSEMLKMYDDVLSYYPHLKRSLPNKYPQDPKFKITHSSMRLYSRARETSYWNHMNLPLAIHSITDPDKVASDFGRSILQILDDFTARFERQPGLKSTLAPLLNPRTIFNCKNGPQFWSVISCALLALKYERNGCEILGFEQKIGVGDKDADIFTKKSNGTKMYVDIEMWHKAEIDSFEIAAIQDELRKRIDEKIGKKMQDLPADDIGVVAVVCATRGLSFELLQQNPCLGGLFDLGSERPRKYGHVYWLAIVNDGQARHVDVLDQPLKN